MHKNMTQLTHHETLIQSITRLQQLSGHSKTQHQYQFGVHSLSNNMTNDCERPVQANAVFPSSLSLSAIKLFPVTTNCISSLTNVFSDFIARMPRTPCKGDAPEFFDLDHFSFLSNVRIDARRGVLVVFFAQVSELTLARGWSIVKLFIHRWRLSYKPFVHHEDTQQ